MDRLLPNASPVALKYRRVVEGLEMRKDHQSSQLPQPPHQQQNSSHDSRVAGNSGTPKAISAYRRLFGEEIVSGTGSGGFFAKPGGTASAQSSPSFVASTIRPSPRRPLTRTPIKILDAPGLEDDFYLNLVDWDRTGNRISVLLGGCEVYFWDGRNLRSDSGDAITAAGALNSASLGRLRQSTAAKTAMEKGCVIKWTPAGSEKHYLALGTKQGSIEIWDVERGQQVHCWRGHPNQRCGVLSWNMMGNGLSSGGRDHRLCHFDLRTPGGLVDEIAQAHTQEICGLNGLLASGGNDNQLLIWDRRRSGNAATTPLLKLNAHTAAVKAVDWSPHQSGLLASGGGTADRTVRFWNTKLPFTPKPPEGFGQEPLDAGYELSTAGVSMIQASSQVCTLAWSPLAPGEILSTHGFSEHNLALWSHPGGECLGTLEGHSQRVLFQAVGPDGSTVVTGSGDETLRFWDAFRRPPKSKKAAGRLKHDADLLNVLQASR